MPIDNRKYTEVADNPPTDETLLKIHKQWKIHSVTVGKIKLRAGLFPSQKPQLKATVLYLEGLADSMYNHENLINTLSLEGYQVIAFDYPGQGGSEGSMNQTRITANDLPLDKLEGLLGIEKSNDHFSKFKEAFNKHKPELFDTFLISDMADKVWEEIKKKNDIDPTKQINAVIGWSTGGLAAYEWAKDNKEGIKAVVLIAPGTNTKFVDVIETKTLNGSGFQHLDNIRPNCPVKIPGFSMNLLASGHASQDWKVENDIKGLVLLSDPEKDSYVDSEAVGNTLKRNAKHFEFVKYDGAAHEIDNETIENRKTDNILLETKVANFLDKVLS